MDPVNVPGKFEVRSWDISDWSFVCGLRFANLNLGKRRSYTVEESTVRKSVGGFL